MGSVDNSVVRVRQGDDASRVSEAIKRKLDAQSVVFIENAGEYAQKMVATVEMAKRELEPPVYQYNKLEIAGVKTLPSDANDPTVPPKIQYRIPKLQVCLSRRRLEIADLGDGWTIQLN